MLRKILVLLDHPWLTRYGNLRNLVSVAGGAVVVLAAVIVALVNLVTSVGPVPLVFLGIALVIFGLVGVQKLHERRSRPGVDDSRLKIAVWTKEQAAIDRQADQIVKDNRRREEKS